MISGPTSQPRFEILPLPEGLADEALRRGLLAALPPLSSEGSAGVISITFLAGAGTRWKASLAEARKEPGKWPAGDVAEAFPPEKPRGLFPVPDFIRGARGERQVAMAAYAFDAVRDVGRHVVVVRGWEDEIDAQALGPAGIPPERRIFYTQRTGADGQVSGHGDAALQCRELWRDARYVVTNFAGDANSWLTVELALRAFAQFDARGVDVGVLIPVARTEKPSYPVYLDEGGLPAGFWHEKLAGSKPGAVPTSLTNVGIRVYRADRLLDALLELKEKYYTPGTERGAGWHIPGNDPAKHECALDNVDNLLAGTHLARVMPTSLPRELTPLKSLDEYSAFVRAVGEVQRELSAVRRGAC
jgi:hypothetical protein